MVVTKTPKPMRLSAHPPTGFVGMKSAGIKNLLMNLFVPSKQDVGESMPHWHQAAWRKPHSQVKVQRVNNLAEREPLKEVQEGCQNQRSISQSASWKDVRDFGLNAFLAVGAPVTMNDFFGDEGLEIFRDVFGDA